MFRKKVPVICFRNIILNNSLGCTNSVNLAFARFKQDANLSLLENLIGAFFYLSKITHEQLATFKKLSYFQLFTF